MLSAKGCTTIVGIVRAITSCGNTVEVVVVVAIVVAVATVVDVEVADVVVGATVNEVVGATVCTQHLGAQHSATRAARPLFRQSQTRRHRYVHVVFARQCSWRGQSHQRAASAYGVQFFVGQGQWSSGQVGRGFCLNGSRSQFERWFASRLAKPQSAQTGGCRGPFRHLNTVCTALKALKALKRNSSVAERLLC